MRRRRGGHCNFVCDLIPILIVPMTLRLCGRWVRAMLCAPCASTRSAFAARTSAAPAIQSWELPDAPSVSRRSYSQHTVPHELSLLAARNPNPMKAPIQNVVVLKRMQMPTDHHSHHTHDDNIATLRIVETVLKQRGITYTVKFCNLLTKQDVMWANLILAVGGDGTFLTACHQVDEFDTTPILGVNSSPRASYGFFAAANRDTFPAIFDGLCHGT